jgi:hypothetical protein
MQTNVLLDIARESISKVPFCFAITTGANQEVNARIIQPGALHEDWSVGFMTSRRGRKVAEMERSGGSRLPTNTIRTRPT